MPCVGADRVTLLVINKRVPVRAVAMNRLAYSILEACEAACIGRTNLYEAIRTGELRAVKHGKRTLILANDLRVWLEGLPALTSKTKP
jgi:excisionase family DNA binding protein